MKHSLPTLFLICALAYTVSAQITVTNATFPVAYDTLLTKTDNLPNVIIMSPGADMVWDYSNLDGLISTQQIFLPASEAENADAFSSAELYENGEAGETFVNITENTFEYLGFAGADPAGLGLDVITQFSPPIADRRAPLNYEDENTDAGNILFPFAFDDLPPFLTDSLDLPITPDSIRIKVEVSRTSSVDAWGTMTIPEGTYEVLRERRFEENDTRLEAKVGFFPWADVTDLLGGLDGLGVFGVDTTITYRFLSNISKEPIAIATVDNNDENIVTAVQYKSSDVTLSNDVVRDSGKPGVFAYPNPAIDFVRFEFNELVVGSYKLKIFNILGSEVWSDSFYIRNNRTMKFDLSELDKGTYLYSLVNDAGKTIATKRLMILKP